jgi:hypothetical protein
MELLTKSEALGSLVFEALRYNPEGRGSKPDEVNYFYQLI